MRVSTVSRLEEVPAEDWNALVGENNPFIEHAFLSLLETSGSVGWEAGWEPTHVLVWEGEKLVGAAPTYLKDNSYGEYIFDWSWASASQRLGLPYYPKLTIAVPFTPATGPRLLVHPDADKEAVWKKLVAGLRELMKASGAWNLHILFCLEEEAEFLEKQGLIRRATHQFHWRNDGYKDFGHFLKAMRSQARKQVRRERRRVSEYGIDIEILQGEQVTEEDWKTLYRLYMSTSARKWGTPYLTRAFFEDAHYALGATPFVVFARERGEVVAGTLSFIKGDHLYGRYWGSFARFEGLHFELCYYQLVEYAIENGLSLVEAGAQGHHKLKRGFLPVVTHSAHDFKHSALHDAFDRICKAEQEYTIEDITSAQCQGPFREDGIPDYPPSAGIPLPCFREK